MLSEFVKKIEELSHKATSAKIITADQEPDHIYYLQKPDGSIELIESSPPFRNHQASNLETIAEIAKAFLGGDNASVSAWVGKQQVVLLHDDNDRRSRTTLALTISKQLLQLKEWEERVAWYSAADLVRLLRKQFSGGYYLESLIQWLRRTKIRRNEEGEKTLDHGKASIGKSIQAELAGVGATPDQVVFTVPTFAGQTVGGHVSHVKANFEVDLDSETFAIVPHSGSFADALTAAEDFMSNRLAELVGEHGGFSIYNGTP